MKRLFNTIAVLALTTSATDFEDMIERKLNSLIFDEDEVPVDYI